MLHNNFPSLKIIRKKRSILVLSKVIYQYYPSPLEFLYALTLTCGGILLKCLFICLEEAFSSLVFWSPVRGLFMFYKRSLVSGLIPRLLPSVRRISLFSYVREAESWYWYSASGYMPLCFARLVSSYCSQIGLLSLLSSSCILLLSRCWPLSCFSFVAKLTSVYTKCVAWLISLLWLCLLFSFTWLSKSLQVPRPSLLSSYRLHLARWTHCDSHRSIIFI